MSAYDRAYYKAHREKAIRYAVAHKRDGYMAPREPRVRVCIMPGCHARGEPQGLREFFWGDRVVCKVCRKGRGVRGRAVCLLCGADLDHGEHELCAGCLRYLTLVAGSVWVIVGDPEGVFRGRLMDDEMFLSMLDDHSLPDGLRVEHWVCYRCAGIYEVDWDGIVDTMSYNPRGDGRELRP